MHVPSEERVLYSGTTTASEEMPCAFCTVPILRGQRYEFQVLSDADGSWTRVGATFWLTAKVLGEMG